MKIRAVTWASDISLLLQAGRDLGLDIKAWSSNGLEETGALESCIDSLREADLILLHPSHEGYWDDIMDGLEGISLPIIAFGRDSSHWAASNVALPCVLQVNRYVVYGGLDNIKNMLKYLVCEVLGKDCAYDPPEEGLWQGLYHPRANRAFSDVEDYLAWYGDSRPHWVGVLFFRTYWANGDLEIVDALIEELEAEGLGVLPAFCFGMGDSELGAKSSGQVVEEFFSGKVDALINLQSLFHSGNVEASREVLAKLDIPVFHPLTVYHSTEEMWREDIHGMSSAEVGWSVAMPEFEGVIDPILLGVATTDSVDGAEFERHRPVSDRQKKISRRVGRWITLAKKPVSQRKVAFILHNNPCASAEATVGGAAHLDSLESTARILNAMKDAGYAIENPPESGKELIETIMERKAISEFRWTSIEETVEKGGALAFVGLEEYLSWFDKLPPTVKSSMIQVWGEPPGEEVDGVPPAMVHQGKIVVTGVSYGCATVGVQPKRGCAGSRCDGQVCRILHDPKVPPPHQYLATYRYLENVFGADLIVHVGTHGNLEFLPGKSVALSDSCLPDVVIGDLPHLYIYNADNPPEGTIAKRRSYAVLVDHMQTAMTESGLYGDLLELEDRIAEYNKTKASDKARAHALEHMILDLLERLNLSEEIGLKGMIDAETPFDAVLERSHDKITEIYNTQIPDGMHIFGERPVGIRRTEFINSILRFDSEMRNVVSRLLGLDLPGDPARLDRLGKELISAFLAGEGPEAARRVLGDDLVEFNEDLIRAEMEKVIDISARIESSDEIGSLLHGFDGGFIPPGPSGLITRGRPDILPTGRNFFSLDPGKAPTQAAWKVGVRLAQAMIEKYREEKGALPENVAMFWMASDIMWADGEELAQMLHLIGVEPIWKAGSVKGYRIIPLEELGRPRIDMTIRVSGITRDCFFNCIELLDGAIKEVSNLDEPPEMNFLRKHQIEGGESARIFASAPGTYGNGVNLAVYASAWEDDKDLAAIFVHWNGYAYGKGVFGEKAHNDLVSMLKTVDLTFNKTVTDEYDLFGCCCYFGTHGGLTGAAREISGKEVSAYYGDTRDRDRVGVRSLADEVRRVVRTKLLNPKWIDGMRRHGYKGAGDISKRVGRVYGWEATTQEVDDWIFDDIAETFVLDEGMRRFFQENNPWALEEIGRRLLEANQRGLWKADLETIDGLKEAYLEMEGWLEESMGDIQGQFQGGSIDVITPEEVRQWREKISKASGD
ncbi:MAG: cobaltochelatase subunit CobN [Methanotrichaceae archaeon]|nr:cobaltochelatase subunit CobN [Methanotrichaceae archaeon]